MYLWLLAWSCNSGMLGLWWWELYIFRGVLSRMLCTGVYIFSWGVCTTHSGHCNHSNQTKMRDTVVWDLLIPSRIVHVPVKGGQQ